MKLSRVSFRQTGVARAILNDGTEKYIPLYDTNLFRELNEILEYMDNIKKVVEVIEVSNLFEKRDENEKMTEELMDRIRSGFPVSRLKIDKSIYK